jgi:tetratricopeptide (TPR) repeat protein
MQLDANSVLVNTLMGLYWERQQDYSNAQLYLEHAISLSPDDPYLYSELGNILSKGGDLPAAQSVFEAAIQVSHQDPLFYRLLAEFALENQIQIRELALPAARQAVILDRSDSNSLDLMAQIMLFLQDYRSAERFSLNALQADPGFAPAYLHLGMSYVYLGESELARQWLGLAESVDPNSPSAAQAKRMLAYYFP